jgi:hypothetical protein
MEINAFISRWAMNETNWLYIFWTDLDFKITHLQIGIAGSFQIETCVHQQKVFICFSQNNNLAFYK